MVSMPLRGRTSNPGMGIKAPTSGTTTSQSIYWVWTTRASRTTVGRVGETVANLPVKSQQVRGEPSRNNQTDWYIDNRTLLQGGAVGAGILGGYLQSRSRRSPTRILEGDKTPGRASQRKRLGKQIQLLQPREQKVPEEGGARPDPHGEEAAYLG